MRRLVVMGAGGRDFHNFNVVYRDDPEVEVVAFTATQIPGIAGRTYPPSLAGPRYPDGIPILAEHELIALVGGAGVNEVVFAYSDVSYEHVMHRAAAALAAGADFTLLGPSSTMIESPEAGRRRVLRSHRERQEPDEPRDRPCAAGRRRAGGPGTPPDAVSRPRGDPRTALRNDRRYRCVPSHDRGARGVRAAGRSGNGRLLGSQLCQDPGDGRERDGRDRLGRRQQRSSLSFGRTC